MAFVSVSDQLFVREPIETFVWSFLYLLQGFINKFPLCIVYSH